MVAFPSRPMSSDAIVDAFSERTDDDRRCHRRSAEREIDLLREYRTRLIADVVTGKLDVREAAARLPDEVEEPEPRREPARDGHGEPTTIADGAGAIEA